ncbi:MAG: iron ABC transporter permease [archaeon]|nr:iron ABC transporter permease [archaeon]
MTDGCNQDTSSPRIDRIAGDSVLSESVKKSVMDWSNDGLDPSNFETCVKKYRLEIKHKILFIIALIVGTVVLSSYSTTLGTMDIGFLDTYRIIWEHIIGDIKDTTLDFLVVEYRLPRVCAAIITGVGLSICGCLMQGVLKNPLADPYTTGVSSGAAFGATLVMTTGFLAAITGFATVISAFVFAMVPITVIIMMSKFSNASPTTMIMAGIGVMYVFNAFTTLMMLWADPMNLTNLYRWQVGSIAMVSSWANIPYMAGVVIVGLIIMMVLSKQLNVLASGDESAKSMGINADRLRLVSLVLTGVVSAGVVSFTGLIGFVGLVCPHIVRMFVGSDNKYLIPGSAALGAFVLLVADTIGKSGWIGFTIQTGVVMAFIGGPVFLWLILRRSNQAW